MYTSIQLLSDGRFSMSGPINPGISDYYLSNTIDGAIINRFTTNGELDATFTTASVALVRNSHKQSSHKSRASYAVHDQSHIANLANGKTMLFAGSNNGTDIAARFQSNGALDTSFSTNGKQFLDSSLCKSPGDVVVQPGG